MRNRYHESFERIDRARAAIAGLLQDELVKCTVTKCTLEMEIGKDTSVVFDVEIGGLKSTFRSTGVGTIDAMYNAFRSTFSPKTKTLDRFAIASFSVKDEISSSRDGHGSKEPLIATLVLESGPGKTLAFQNKSPDVTRACINVVVSAIEFIVNAEKAFLAGRIAATYYEDHHMQEALVRVSGHLQSLVAITPYADLT